MLGVVSSEVALQNNRNFLDFHLLKSQLLNGISMSDWNLYESRDFYQVLGRQPRRHSARVETIYPLSRRSWFDSPSSSRTPCPS